MTTSLPQLASGVSSLPTPAFIALVILSTLTGTVCALLGHNITGNGGSLAK